MEAAAAGTAGEPTVVAGAGLVAEGMAAETTGLVAEGMAVETTGFPVLELRRSSVAMAGRTQPGLAVVSDGTARVGSVA